MDARDAFSLKSIARYSIYELINSTLIEWTHTKHNNNCFNK